MSEPLPCVEINPEGPHTASVIWLHGLGADGHDFVPVVPHLKLPPRHGFRFVFPHAPAHPVTLNDGMIMPAWFDIYSLEDHTRVDETGIKTAKQAIFSLIEHEVERGIPTDRIILAGFSQGGTIALLAGCTYPKKLAGMIALSTFLPTVDKLKSKAYDTNRTTPIFMAHGLHDPLLLPQWGESSCKQLQQLGYSISWHTYAMEHAVCPQEIAEIGTWLQNLPL